MYLATEWKTQIQGRKAAKETVDVHDNNVCKRPSVNPSVHIFLLFSEKCIFYNLPTGELLGTVFLGEGLFYYTNFCKCVVL